MNATSTRRIGLTRGFAAALLTFSIALTACDHETSVVQLVIPDFDTSQVEGVSLWRLSETTGLYERVDEIEFTTATAANGTQVVEYHYVGANGVPILIESALDRGTDDPDNVSLSLLWRRVGDSGSYRISTYNPGGDSPLSSAVAYF